MESGRAASLMEELCQQMTSLTQSVNKLQDCYFQLEGRLESMTQAPVAGAAADPASPSPAEPSVAAPTIQLPPPEPRVPTPDRFSGDRSTFRAFRNACRLYFMLQPRTFATETAKVGFVISLLTHEPQAWAHRLWEQENPILNTVTSFFDGMALLYDDPQRAATAETTLHSLHQGRRPVEDYVAEFRRWSTDTDWNEPALRCQFRLGLSDTLKDELARVGVPATLEDMIRQAIQIDRRLRERRSERYGPNRPTWVLPRVPPPPMPSRPPRQLADTTAADVPEPMQLGLIRAPLTPEEKNRRRQLNLCLYCGEPGHYANSCPNKARKCASTSIPVPKPVPPAETAHLIIPLSFQLPEGELKTQAIIDSGACSCFIDHRFALSHQIPLVTKAQTMTVHLADGSRISSGPVTLETMPLSSVIAPDHTELLRLDVITSPLFPVILGLPWLRAHNPLIDWGVGTISLQSPYCLENCRAPTVETRVALCQPASRNELLHLVPPQYHGFLDVFDKQNAERLPPHRPYDCPIELLPGAKIPFGRVYPLSEPESDVLRDYITDNLQRGFIRPSTSPAGAGIFFVEKKDHSLRPCIDYRELNLITVKNRYPLPLIPELFQRLRSATIFTKLDLRGAYNLVRIREGDEWKTAFRSRFGHYEYLVMPFGLCNAPATFQHFVNDVFRDFLDLFVIVYLDDILIFSATLEQHRTHVRLVLARLRQHGLFAKAEKCEFETNSIRFLGFVISPSGVAMDPHKVSAVLEWPPPTDKKGVQRFVGFANFYRKFIKDFSLIIAPITQLTRRMDCFSWTPAAQAAFSALKGLFTSAPILRHPDPALPFVMEVDASETAVGAVLSQRHGPKSLLHPVAFFSRQLSPAERNYGVGDRELLAIKLALDEWRYLLEGASQPFLIYTDHKNLEYLRSARRLNPRQARWALFFTRFHFHITFRPGSKNCKPDALSRTRTAPQSLGPPDTVLQDGNFLLLQQDLISQIRSASSRDLLPTNVPFSEEGGLLLYDGKIFVPPALRLIAFELCHDSPLAGHYGVRKTLDLIQRYFWWPAMAADCRHFVESCTVCLRNKGSHARAWGLLQPLPVPDRPWRDIAMDFITDLPPSEGFTGIFVVVDRFTKMAHFSPLPGVPTAAETARVFIRDVVRLHGLPVTIVSDRGVQFTSRFWRALCAALGIRQCLSSAYHPQSNGQTERTNQSLEQYLRCFTTYSQQDWATLLPMAEFAFNNSNHSASGQSPFFSNYGYHPAFLPLALPESALPAVQSALDFLTANNKLLRSTLLETQKTVKQHYDLRRRGDLSLNPGDLVWLSSANLRLTCPSRKLGPRFLGPFPVAEKINPVAYRLTLPPSLRIHPVFHVALLKKHVPSPFPARSSGPLDPVTVNGEDEFEVEAVLDCRRRGGTLQYLIKWKGYGPEDNSWEPASGVHAPRLVNQFFRSRPGLRHQMGIRRLPVARGHCQDARATLRVARAHGGTRIVLPGARRVRARARVCVGVRRRARARARADVVTRP